MILLAVLGQDLVCLDGEKGTRPVGRRGIEDVPRLRIDPNAPG
jgi:hypothetical protein